MGERVWCLGAAAVPENGGGGSADGRGTGGYAEIEQSRLRLYCRQQEILGLRRSE